MIRLLVLSDSHGDSYALEKAIRAQKTAEVILFLGDGAQEAQEIAQRLPADRTLIAVRGNNDWRSRLPLSEELTLEGQKLFFTHGHAYQVKHGLEQIVEAAEARRADMLLFGHTHTPYTQYISGLHVLNPGSVAFSKTYGIVDITSAGIATNIVSLR